MSKFEEWLKDKRLGSMELEFAKEGKNTRPKDNTLSKRTCLYA